jgi:hypothetical protein
MSELPLQNSACAQATIRRAGLAVLWLLVTVSMSGCFFRKQVRVFNPPPPPPPQTVPAPEPPTLPPPQLESVGFGSQPPSLPDGEIPELPGPPKPPPPRRSPVAATPKPPLPVETQPVPKLGQIFTAQQLRDYNRSLDESLDRVRKALEVLARKSLTAEQSETAERIRTFQKQAEQARGQDLVTAVSLARRADLLAQDLLTRLP